MARLLSALRRIDDALARAEGAVIVLCVSLMLFLAFGQVALRPVTSGFPWADQLARFLVLWTGVLGASLATRRRKHIAIDVVTKFLSPRGRAIAALIGNGLGILLCAFLLLVSIRYVAANRENATLATTMHLPIWLVQSVIPYGFAAMFLRFLDGVLEDAQGLLTGDFSYQKQFEEAPEAVLSKGEGS